MDDYAGRNGSMSVHYHSRIVLAGVLGLFASLGIGRFSLGMLLPSTGQALALDYAQMGALSTINFCGYLAAVLACGRLQARFGPRRLIAAALLQVGGSMVFIGASSHLWLIMGLYCLTGVGSALSNIPIMSLVATWFPARHRGRIAGTLVMGNGLGILMAGRLIPWVNSTGAAGWRSSWVLLGIMALVVAGICWLAIPGTGVPAPKAVQRAAAPTDRWKPAPPMGRRLFYQCAALYFLFGFTYVIFVTFFVTALVQQRGFSEYSAGWFWSWIGLLSLVSGPLFGLISDRTGRKTGLVLVFAIQAAAYLLTALEPPLGYLYLAIGCFGITAWSVPSIIAALVSDHAGPEHTATMFGRVTFVFGIGQILGPLIAGLLSEQAGTFNGGFYLAGILALAAAVLAAWLPGGTGRTHGEPAPSGG